MAQHNEQQRTAELTGAEKAAFAQKTVGYMVAIYPEYPFSYEAKLARIITPSIDAFEASALTGEIPEQLVEAMEIASFKAIQTVPLHVIDELEISFTKAAIVTWPADPVQAAEAAKRTALIWYDAFWPFEHPGAVAQAARVGNIANALPAPVFLADMDGRITFASVELDLLLEEIEGLVERQTMTSLFDQRLNIGTDQTTQIEKIIGGAKRHFEVTVIPSEGPGGTEYFGFILDRSREVELEQLQDGVMNAISHELRTPLTAIVGYLELLANHQIPASDVDGALTDAAEAAQRLSKLVNSILNFAKFAGGTAVLYESSWSASMVIENTIERTLGPDDVRPTLNLQPAQLVADRDRFEEVVVQLLTNARLHGGSDVRISTRIVGEGLEIEVADNGTGFPFRNASRAVEAFVHAPRSPGQGAGIGLTICHGIVEAHGGTLTLANRPGACVTAWFPNATAE